MLANRTCSRRPHKTASARAFAHQNSSRATPASPILQVRQTLVACCVCILVFVGTLPRTVFASGPSATLFEISQVADGVFVHTGRHVGIAHGERGDSANAGFIVGTKCVAVVDSGGAIEVGKALHQAIKERSALPICYVINTHIHFDHVLGNAAFAGPTVKFVGHTELAEALVNNREFFGENFAKELGGSSPSEIVEPTLNVEDTLQLDIGDRLLTLQAVPLAHSHTDLTVFDEQTKTLFSGDLVFIDRLPIVDGSLRGWLAWITEARTRPIQRVVPGHGPSSAPWPHGVQSLEAYLSVLLTDGRDAVRNGVTLEEAIATMSRSAARKWLVNDRHRRNVSKVYRELEWE